MAPGWFLISGYLLLILTGALLLMMPVSTTAGSLRAVDALFTSASAVCVTGLVVVDTASAFTLFGKIVILMLIQVGGLGIMVLSTLFLLSLGKKVGMTGRMLIHDTYSYNAGQNAAALIKDLLVFTLVIESIGAILLFYRFTGRMPVEQASFFAVFHAISAFCNAGFSLFSDSFIQYHDDAFVSMTICCLIISGGIGFIVLSELKNSITAKRNRRHRLSLHSKLVLSSTALLLFISTGFVLGIEWHNILAGQSWSVKTLNAFFHAVNSRTAGFNSFSVGDLTNETLFFTMILMFIGTAPGSCGGGIKITTFASMVILGLSRFRGQASPHIFYRKISQESISKAVSVILISLFVIILGTMLLLQFEIDEISHQLTRGAFLELMFETISAFGTVGLSTGVTGTLSTAGKIIITAIMFTGRLGPLVIAMTMGRRIKSTYEYPYETIMIG